MANTKHIVKKKSSGDTDFDAAINKFFPKKEKVTNKVKILPFFTPLDLKINRLEVVTKYLLESQPKQPVS